MKFVVSIFPALLCICSSGATIIHDPTRNDKQSELGLADLLDEAEKLEIMMDKLTAVDGEYEEMLRAQEKETNLFNDETVSVGVFANEMCSKDEDCKDEGRSHCLTQNMPSSGSPQKHHCYECLNNYDCDPDGTRTCDIDRGGTRCQDNQLDFPYLTGISGAKYGYNIFKADPMLLTQYSKDMMDDSGIPRKAFFRLTPQYDTTFPLNGDTYSVPREFTARATAVFIGSMTTTTLLSSDAVKTASSSYAKVEGSGSYSGIKMGGGLGVSAYKKTSESFESSTTMTSSKQEKQLYKFELLDGTNLKFHSWTETALQELTNSGSVGKWYNFFEEFGTHLTHYGVMGRMKTVSYSFSSSQREKIVEEGKTFDVSVKAGIAGIFAAEGSAGGDGMTETSNKISEFNSNSHILRLGGEVGSNNTPVIIKRLSLKPICEYIPSNKYKVAKDSCEKMMEEYCKEKLGEAGLNNDKCEYKDEYECVDHIDCGEYKNPYAHLGRGLTLPRVECVAGKCIKWKIGHKGKSCREKCTSIGAECKEIKTTTNHELHFRVTLARKPSNEIDNHAYPGDWKTDGRFNPVSAMVYKDGVKYLNWYLGDKTPDCDATFEADFDDWYGLCACA